MKTQHAHEIRKGIVFARQMLDAKRRLKGTSLAGYPLVWTADWEATASVLSQKAFSRTFLQGELKTYQDYLKEYQSEQTDL